MRLFLICGAGFLLVWTLRRYQTGSGSASADYDSGSGAGLPSDARVVVGGLDETPVDWGADYDWSAVPDGIEAPIASGRLQG